jgi:hypothetical protein
MKSITGRKPMTLWNTPPGYLAGDGALARAAAAFMRDTQELDLVIADAGWSGDAAVRRRQDAYASAQELAEAVRDQERLTRRMEAAVAAAEDALKEIALCAVADPSVTADAALTAMAAARAFGAGTEAVR